MSRIRLLKVFTCCSLSLVSVAALQAEETLNPPVNEASAKNTSDSSTEKISLTKQVPSEFQGKNIRKITVTVRQIFDKEDTWLFRTANNLKIPTLEKRVRKELYVKEGDRYDQFLIDESARNLRSQKFLREIKITPTLDGDQVDLHVSVQDTWTLIPQFSFSSGDGRDKTAVGIAEANVMGWGARGEIGYEDDEGRETIEVLWDDTRVMGSDFRLLTAYFDRSDGREIVGFFGKPFRSLVEKTAWSVDGRFLDSVGRLFANGDERFIFGQEKLKLSGRYKITRGDPHKLLRRFSFGYDYVRDSFDEATASDFEDVDVNPEDVSRDPSLLAEDRRYSGPVLVYEKIEPEFVSMNYIDRFDRVADYNIGENFGASLFLAPEIFGSRDDAGLFSMNRTYGKKFTEHSFLRSEIGVASRLEDSDFENSLLRAEIKYYRVLGPLKVGDYFAGKHTLATALRIDYGDDFDRDRELLAGGKNALRGYEAKTFFGDKRLILNIEDRVHLLEDVLQLVSIGGVAFIDAGGATFNSFGDLVSDEFYTDVGVGLRLAFPRVSGGRILRVDLAFPLRDGPDGSDFLEPRVIVSGGQIFSARLRSESLGAEKANTSIGFDD